MVLLAALALGVHTPAVKVSPRPRIVVAGEHGAKLQAKIDNGVVMAYVAEHGRILKSAKRFFQEIGAQLAFDHKTNILSITEVGRQIGISAGATTMSVDGEQTSLPTPISVHDGEVTIPLRAVVEALGATVQFRQSGDNSTSTAIVMDLNDTPVVTSFPSKADAVSVNNAPPVVLDSHPLVEDDDTVDRDRTRLRLSFDGYGPSWITAGGVTERSALVFQPCGGELAATFNLNGTPLLFDVGDRTCRYRLQGGAIQLTTTQAQLGVRIGDSDFYPAMAFQNTAQRDVPSTQAWGIGLNKQPTPGNASSFEGNVMYYPFVTSAACRDVGCGRFQQLSFGLGVVQEIGQGFIHAGYRADHQFTSNAFNNGITRGGMYFGLGLTL